MAEMSTVLALTVLLAIVVFRWRRSPRLPFPPGPKPWPIIGNIMDMPTFRPWETYRDWCNTYNSDLVLLRSPEGYAIVIGSVQVAKDLLEKRSQLHSERTPSILLDLMGFGDFFSTMSYSDPKWQDLRRMFHQYFSHNSVQNYRSAQLQQVRTFLTWAAASPQDTKMHVRRLITSIIVLVTYGKQITGMDDEYVNIALKTAEGLSVALIPGKFWIEFLPFLRYVPSWVPGAAAKQLADEYLPYSVSLKDKPYAEVKAAMANGTARPSVASSLIEEIQEKYAGTPEAVKYDAYAKTVSAVAYIGAAETTASSAEHFLVAMAMFPDIQKKAQAELDRVVGTARFPNYDDLEDLPYIRAIMLETLRWLPVAPFGIPHASLTDDEYNGYHIPKGTTLIPNIWAMLHNPEDYSDPERFRPERFIGPDGKIDVNVQELVRTTVFGFGRRMCAGRYFAEDTLAIFVASTLHVFNISPGVDAHGQPMKLSAEVDGGLVTTTPAVPTGLTPRSETAAQLISEVAAGLGEM